MPSITRFQTPVLLSPKQMLQTTTPHNPSGALLPFLHWSRRTVTLPATLEERRWSQFPAYIVRESGLLISDSPSSNPDFCFHSQSKELNSVLSESPKKRLPKINICTVLYWVLQTLIPRTLRVLTPVSLSFQKQPVGQVIRTLVILTQANRFTRKMRSISNLLERLKRETLSSCWFSEGITLSSTMKFL